MFYLAAIWNWIAASTFLFGASLMSAMGISSPIDGLGKQLFCMMVAVFGLGYYLVARDLSLNRGIVILGIVGKLGVVALIIGNVVAGRVQFAFAVPILVDALFVILFAQFLRNYR
jgi:hypothetical protein